MKFATVGLVLFLSYPSARALVNLDLNLAPRNPAVALPVLRTDKIRPLHAYKSLKNDKEVEKSTPDSSTRRNLLVKSGSVLASALLVGQSAAKAQEDTDEKIVLQTSSENYPLKYVGTSTSPVSNLPDSAICEDSEARRIAVFERTAPSVVFLDTFREERDAFSTNVMEVPLGAGSGFVWDEQGHIVTNYHVVRNAKSAQVAILTKVFPNEGEPASRSTVQQVSSEETVSPPTFTSRRPGNDPNLTSYKRSVYKARVVGVDPGKDVAVLKVDAPVFDLFPIDLGTSTGLKVGQQVLAIGNPFGLDHSMTSGIISGVGREIRSPSGRPISNVIQSDAAINAGNSGGPLLDKNGRLIGMNTAIFSPSGGSAGIGFAIPVDTVKYIVETLIREGRVVRPILGISYLESKQARALGITRGVLVLDVPTNTPAYKAGLRGTRRTDIGLIEMGDIITKVENTVINTEADLFEALESYKPGDKVKVTVSRIDVEGESLRAKDIDMNIELKASSDVMMPSGFGVPYHGRFQ